MPLDGMTPAYLLQTLASLLAILLLVGLAWWAKISRPAAALDEASAYRLIADEFPDHVIGPVWIAADGSSAVARSGDEALIVYRLGDGHVARAAPWAELLKTRPRNGIVALALKDLTAPRVRLTLAKDAHWPPMHP